MSVFPNWQKFAVQQKRKQTGCIPTGYEMLLKAAKTKEIEWDSFQDDFDLDRNGGTPKNNFQDVAAAIKAKYPHVEFRHEEFPKGKGSEKLKRLEELLKQQKPVLVSVAQQVAGGWHIMPVVDMDDESLTLLTYFGEGGPITQVMSKAELVKRHDEWAGGGDIAFLP